MTEEQLIVMKVHRDNITFARTFEEFQRHQVNYINYLIEDDENKIEAEKKAGLNFINKSEAVNGS